MGALSRSVHLSTQGFDSAVVTALLIGVVDALDDSGAPLMPNLTAFAAGGALRSQTAPPEAATCRRRGPPTGRWGGCAMSSTGSGSSTPGWCC